jgi:hypothetical protein
MSALVAQPMLQNGQPVSKQTQSSNVFPRRAVRPAHRLLLLTQLCCHLGDFTGRADPRLRLHFHSECPGGSQQKKQEGFQHCSIPASLLPAMNQVPTCPTAL